MGSSACGRYRVAGVLGCGHRDGFRPAPPGPRHEPAARHCRRPRRLVNLPWPTDVEQGPTPSSVPRKLVAARLPTVQDLTKQRGAEHDDGAAGEEREADRRIWLAE